MKPTALYLLSVTTAEAAYITAIITKDMWQNYDLDIDNTVIEARTWNYIIGVAVGLSHGNGTLFLSPLAAHRNIPTI